MNPLTIRTFIEPLGVEHGHNLHSRPTDSQVCPQIAMGFPFLGVLEGAPEHSSLFESAKFWNILGILPV
jgi:hypothetical protein